MSDNPEQRIDSPARILIVEDTLGVARSLNLGLGLYRGGIFRTEACSTGEDALKRLRETQFDLVVSDLKLPGIDGLTLLERARLIRPEIRSVLITAFGSAEVEQRAGQLVDAYLPKPFLLQDIIHLVERVLSEPARPLPSAPQAETPAAEDTPGVEPQTGAPAAAGAEAKPSPAPPVTGDGSKRKSVHLSVLACDLDGTLTDEGVVASSTWEQLKAAKMAGIALILVTGRTLENLAAFSPFNELCEAIVAENGAVVYFPRRDVVVLPFGQLDSRVVRQLETLEMPMERGMAIVATIVPHDEAMLQVIRGNRCSLAVEYNRDSVMFLPAGATKGSGLLYALDELGYSPRNVIACGDAENDRSMFEVVELGVAVANAWPALRAIADVILPRPKGGGVEALIQDLLNGNPLRRRTRPGRRLLLGHRASGAPVHMDAFSLVEANLGIWGSSGSGKSWLAGLLAEELLKQKYQVCIIDPEGDYRSLGVSPRTLLLGGPETPLPLVEDILNISEWNNVSLVLDLSMYSVEERLRYMEDFLRALRGLRARRGRPHYFLVDEIQNFCPPEGGAITDLLLDAMQWGGFGLVSYRPSLIAPALLERLDYLLATRLNLNEEIETLRPWVGRLKDGESVLEQLPVLPKGQAYLCARPKATGLPSGAETIRFRVSGRSIPHIRHLNKYLRAPLPGYKRFYFKQPQGDNLGSAANLWEFREQLERVQIDSLRYHLERGDFTRWLADVLHDDELSRRVNKVANRNLNDGDLRQALLEVVIDRYEELKALA